MQVQNCQHLSPWQPASHLAPGVECIQPWRRQAVHLCLHVLDPALQRVQGLGAAQDNGRLCRVHLLQDHVAQRIQDALDVHQVDGHAIMLQGGSNQL